MKRANYRLIVGLTGFCDHKCWYCCGNKPYLRPRKSLIDYIGSDNFMDLVKRVVNEKEDVMVCLSGGEPTQSRFFEEILFELLNNDFKIQLQSNGQHWGKIMKVVQRFPEKCKDNFIIENSFHYGQYVRDDDDKRIENWLKGFSKYSKYSKDISIVIPVTPDIVFDDDFVLYLRRIKEINENTFIDLNPLSFHRNDLDYPSDYTDDELKRVEEIRFKYTDDERSFQDRIEIRNLSVGLELQGWKCSGMTDVLAITWEGMVCRCPHGQPVDRVHHYNINDGYVFGELQNKPCTFEKCRCIPKAVEKCLKLNGYTLSKYLEEENEEM